MYSHSVRLRVRESPHTIQLGGLVIEQIDIIIPRGIQNRVAIDMVVKHIQRTLVGKSKKHQKELQRLGKQVEDEPLSQNVLLLGQTKQIIGMSTVLQNPSTDHVDFNFYFDRLSTLLVER